MQDNQQSITPKYLNDNPNNTFSNYFIGKIDFYTNNSMLLADLPSKTTKQKLLPQNTFLWISLIFR